MSLSTCDISLNSEIIPQVDYLLYQEGHPNIWVIPFGTEHGIDGLFGSRWDPKRRVERVEETGRGVRFRMNYTVKVNDQDLEQVGEFLVCPVSDYEGVFLVLTMETSGFFHQGIFPFMKSLYPKASLTFLKHDRLLALLADFRLRVNSPSIIINRASQRIRVSGLRDEKKTMPVVSWPDMSLEEAFSWIDRNNGWFQSLDFELRSNGGVLARVFFSRQGVLRTDSIFTQAYRWLILPTCRLISENRTFFGGRARHRTNGFAVKPLEIDFGEERFEDVNENLKFISAMRKLKTSSVSVLHGNPYLNLSVIDYFDGSTYDLWVLSPSKLVIVPQLESSHQSVRRLINHIFDTYAEGSIGEYISEQ